MEIYVQYSDPKDQLTYLLNRLINIVRYENTNTYKLLKKITINKKALIALDNYKLELFATEEKGYTLYIEKTISESSISFEARSHTLRQILAGTKNIDKAIADQDLFISGNFEDSLNIYKLVINLLSDAVLSFRLRDLWEEFLKTWGENKMQLEFTSYENQNANYDLLIQKIPKNILCTGIKINK